MICCHLISIMLCLKFTSEHLTGENDKRPKRSCKVVMILGRSKQSSKCALKASPQIYLSPKCKMFWIALLSLACLCLTLEEAVASPMPRKAHHHLHRIQNLIPESTAVSPEETIQPVPIVRRIARKKQQKPDVQKLLRLIRQRNFNY